MPLNDLSTCRNTGRYCPDLWFGHFFVLSGVRLLTGQRLRHTSDLAIVSHLPMPRDYPGLFAPMTCMVNVALTV